MKWRKIVCYTASFQDNTKKKGHIFSLHTKHKMMWSRKDRIHRTAVKRTDEMKKTGNVKMQSCRQTEQVTDWYNTKTSRQSKDKTIKGGDRVRARR